MVFLDDPYVTHTHTKENERERGKLKLESFSGEMLEATLFLLLIITIDFSLTINIWP